MSFAVFTDSCSNLPGSLLQHFGIRVLPCSYTVDGKQIIYGGDIEAFDAHTYYELLRQGKRVTTSLLNTQVFLDHFRPALEQGLDVVYVGLSAGISGTYQAACIAAAELRDEFPERTVCPVDSMGAGFGTGLLACRAAELRDEGRSAAEATAVLEQEVQNLCEFFTVSDLMFLHRTGRVQAAAALVGTSSPSSAAMRRATSSPAKRCAAAPAPLRIWPRAMRRVPSTRSCSALPSRTVTAPRTHRRWPSASVPSPSRRS